ncbi:TraB/GumN family protein [Flavobacterium ardleyense]|uniref:TraB/GumN family protein n=1 Tax=Flavobacterium ardleyense TaxID=2038737 RepID=A0ABW5Z8G2_9FLAO
MKKRINLFILKRILFIIALLSITSSIAQEKKYQSLLWEVSGNGLQKKSYVYGSMHVSDKVSYHLSDAFFTHLQNADIVANESEPRTWTSLFDMFSFYSQYADKGSFYTNFYINPLEKEHLYSQFRSSNYNLVSLLTRTNESNKEYQEETYLDMFIYRTGRKFNKKTVGLEDVKTSTIKIMKAQALMDQKEVDKNRQAILKILKNKTYNEALTDYYREKDLDMIDSLSILSSPQSYLKAMLFDRNIEMVKNMDSIMKTGSLFSAIGAAHLPGEKGVIELLRRKGYTVNPVFGPYTNKGKLEKKKIEEYYSKPELKTKTTADGVISLPLFEIFLQNGEDLESPDLANGGYINVKRSLLKDFLNKNNKTFNPKTLDSLFYENIPGEILEKKGYQEKNYYVYDIKNKTKTGNAQHYRYYITPLELITVIMSGEGNYVRRFEDEIFSKITIKEQKENWETIIPRKGSFEIQFPGYYSYRGNKADEKDNADMSIFGYDQSENSHYFLIEKTLQEIDKLEDSEYELKRMHKEFYTQHDIDSTNTKFDKKQLIFTSQSKFEDKEIALESVLKGNKYYLLGSINASIENTKKFFDSFNLIPSIISEKYRTFTDSTANFCIEIPEKQNEHLDFSVEKDYNIGLKKKNHFINKNKNFEFLGSNGSFIQLAYYKFHRYESEKSLDSVWGNYRKRITNKQQDTNLIEEEFADVIEPIVAEEKEDKFDEYINTDWQNILFNSKKDEELKIISEKITTDKNTNSTIFEALVSSPKSSQATKHKVVFNNGEIYELTTLVDKNYKNEDAFVEKVFGSLTLTESKKTTTIFENKLNLFLTDVASKQDTIRYSALKSINYLKFEENDLPKLKNFLNTFTFKDDETEVLGELYEKIGTIKSKSTIAYLETIYKKENTNTIIQFAVLRGLVKQKSKEGYSKIKELLEYDLPISDNEYEISSLFRSFEHDLENSQVLFPEVFQYYSIKEYHAPIVSFTHKVVQANFGNSKKLKSYKKMILTNAKLEYKRLASWKNKQKIRDKEDDEYYYGEDIAPTGDFLSYVHILYPFKNEKEIKLLFEKASDLDIDELDISYAELELEKNKVIDSKTINKVLSNPKTQFIGYLMQHFAKQKATFEKINPIEIAKSAIVYSEKIDPKKDSLSFYETREIHYNNKKITYYFFKKINVEKDSYQTDKEQITGIAFISENGILNIKGYFKLSSRTYLQEKEIKPLMNSLIDQSLNAHHFRASFGKLKDQNLTYNDYNEEF